MSRVTAIEAVFAGALLALLGATTASAQAVHLDQYRAAETPEDGFAVSRPNDLGHLRWGAQLHLDYAYDPLVYEADLGMAGTESASVVEHQLAAQAGFSLGLFDRLVLFAGLPVNLVMDGEEVSGVAAPDGTTLGDVWLGARGRLYGEADDVFAIGVQLVATFPTAQAAHPDMRFSGEDGMTFHPEILAELRPGAGVRITADLGARLRATDRARLNTLSVGHELTYALGVSFPIVEEVLTGHVEAYGAASFEDFGGRQTTPFEAIAGLRVQPVEGLLIGAAAGPGIARGYGTPDFRGVLTVGYAAPAEATSEPEPEPASSPTDRDGDGILDADDGCPDEPEDMDQFQDTDGCPDADNDGDGIPDGTDGCPNEAEDMDGFEDTDGCPDADNDDDGIADGDDGCPDEAEDMDRFEDTDGCPDPDNDQDEILDGDDECPFEPGPAETNGCPVNVRLDQETGTIRILQRIEFANNRDVLLPSATPILEDVRAVLAANPQLTRIRVEGHTDSRGRDQHNMDLSARRARTVMRWLRDHGLEAERLEGVGCGEQHPVEDNGTATGRQNNRRVEFHIVAPAPEGGGRHLPGCTEIAIDS